MTARPAAILASGHDHASQLHAASTSLATTAMAMGVHSAAFLGVTALTAYVVYCKLGPGAAADRLVQPRLAVAAALVVTGWSH